jgi:hypothetical protein
LGGIADLTVASAPQLAWLGDVATESFTAKDAKDTNERNSLTARGAKDAKGIIIRSKATT